VHYPRLAYRDRRLAMPLCSELLAEQPAPGEQLWFPLPATPASPGDEAENDAGSAWNPDL